MLLYDYLVQNTSTKEELYVEEAISAEDAVRFFTGEEVIFSDKSGGMYFFKGLKTGNKYVAIKIKKVFVVTTGKDEEFQIRDIRSDKELSEQYMKQFSDETEFNEIKEMIIDDPKTLNMGVSKDQNIYFIRLSNDLSKVITLLLRKKDIFNIQRIGMAYKDPQEKYYINVVAKDGVEARIEAKKLIQLYKDKEENAVIQ